MLHPMVEHLLSNGGCKMDGESWLDLAKRFGIAPENDESPDGNKRRRNAALHVWKRFLGTKRGLEVKRVLVQDGKVKSMRIGRSEEPKDIPSTDGLELKFVTTTPGGGAFVRHEPPKEKKLSRADIAEVVSEIESLGPVAKDWSPSILFDEFSQVMSLGDVHVGMCSDDNVFGLKWNKEELFSRADTFIKSVNIGASEIVIVFGGDIADGLKGKTNRGGHDLPQNMTDKEQLRTSRDFVLYLLDGVTKVTEAPVKCHFVTNSNHPGIIDLATAEIVSSVVPHRYSGQVSFSVEEKFFGSFNVRGFDFIYTHGYDEQHMKRGMPRFLDKKHFDLIHKYMDHIGVNRCYLLRFDQHQSSKIVYGKFIDIMTPAFSNPSSWVSMNFGADYKGGFVSLLVGDTIRYELIEF